MLAALWLLQSLDSCQWSDASACLSAWCRHLAAFSPEVSPAPAALDSRPGREVRAIAPCQQASFRGARTAPTAASRPQLGCALIHNAAAVPLPAHHSLAPAAGAAADRQLGRQLCLPAEQPGGGTGGEASLGQPAQPRQNLPAPWRDLRCLLKPLAAGPGCGWVTRHTQCTPVLNVAPCATADRIPCLQAHMLDLLGWRVRLDFETGAGESSAPAGLCW